MSSKLLLFFINKYKRIYQIQKYTLRAQGAIVGKNNTFNGWLQVKNPSNLVIGDRNVFNEFVYINCKGKVTIGSDCHFSVNAKLITTKLSKDLKSHISKEIQIGNNVWLAANAMVAVSKTDIKISDFIIVGANTYISRSLKKNGLYFGNNSFRESD